MNRGRTGKYSGSVYGPDTKYICARQISTCEGERSRPGLDYVPNPSCAPIVEMFATSHINWGEQSRESG